MLPKCSFSAAEEGQSAHINAAAFSIRPPVRDHDRDMAILLVGNGPTERAGPSERRLRVHRITSAPGMPTIQSARPTDGTASKRGWRAGCS